jgi:hypothetical protein
LTALTALTGTCSKGGKETAGRAGGTADESQLVLDM